MAYALLFFGKNKEETAMETPRKSTLLDMVQAVSDYATSDEEIVATVAYLINSGKVRLCGNFAGARIDLSVPACPASRVYSPRASGYELLAVQ
jgi:hypothetical protein